MSTFLFTQYAVHVNSLGIAEVRAWDASGNTFMIYDEGLALCNALTVGGSIAVTASEWGVVTEVVPWTSTATGVLIAGQSVKERICIEPAKERLEREIRVEELQRKNRMKELEARKRSQEVLCSVLSEREQKYLKRRKYLRVPSTLRRGFHYRLCIEEGDDFYSEIWHKNEQIGTVCLVTGDDYDDDELPLEDLLLTHYLLLTTDEEDYLTTGNVLLTTNSDEYDWLEEY